MPRPTIRPTRPADTPAIVVLLRECLGARWNEELFRWKHERNPFGPSPGWVAEADGRIVALRVFLRWTWLSGERPVAAFRAVDTAVHPGFRRRGLFSRLTGEALDELAGAGGRFVFNTPNRRSLPGYLGLGWRKVGRVPLLAYPRRPLRMAAGALGRTGEERRELAAGGDHPPVSVLLPELSDPQWLRPAATASEDVRFVTPVSPEYLRWRYADAPGYEYHALAESDRHAGAALVFHRRRRSGLREVKISEILMRGGPEGERLAAGLLARLAREAAADYLVAVAARGSGERRALRRAGFLPARLLGPMLVARPLAAAGDAPDPVAASSWRPSLGDLELF